MKYIALGVILLGNLMIFLPSITVVYDESYREIIGLPWMMVAPIFKLSALLSGLTIVACFFLAHVFDLEIQKEKKENEVSG
jgi:hypothetical protein